MPGVELVKPGEDRSGEDCAGTSTAATERIFGPGAMVRASAICSRPLGLKGSYLSRS